MRTDEEIVTQLKALLKKEIEELEKHLQQENLDSEDPDYIDSSWIYDMYKADDYLGRSIPWEEILRILS